MSAGRNKAPLVGKGKEASFPFRVSVVCWMDLLGYGALIAQANFNPLHERATEAIGRLQRFHRLVAKHSHRYLPTLVMNDGAVAYRDLSFRTRSVTHDFLVRAWNLHKEIAEDEKVRGYPGVRSVLACGFRMRGTRSILDATSSHFTSLMRRYKAKQITPDQAIREAAAVRQSFDIVPQLQANFAFTKSYVAESTGSAGGLGGANFFVDLDLFDSPTPSWLAIGERISWAFPRLALSASFAPLLDLPLQKHAAGGPLGILDGLQVAQRLASDADVLRALRTAREASPT